MKKVNQIDKPFCVVFDRVPDADGATFVEVEDLAGQSIEAKWSTRADGRAELVFACHEAPASKLTRRIRRAVNRLIRAEGADSWKGSGDPDNYEDIERELDMAKTYYANVLKEVDAHIAADLNLRSVAHNLQAEVDALKAILAEVAEKDPHGEFLGHVLDAKIDQAVNGPYGKKV